MSFPVPVSKIYYPMKYERCEKTITKPEKYLKIKMGQKQ